MKPPFSPSREQNCPRSLTTPAISLRRPAHLEAFWRLFIVDAFGSMTQSPDIMSVECVKLDILCTLLV